MSAPLFRLLSRSLAASLVLAGAAVLAAPPKAWRQEVVVAGSPFQGVHGLVVDGKGMTAYYFDADVKGSGTSTCTGGCATAWPAIEATTTTPKVSGITGTVGTIKGVNGGRQITIDGRPIYTFVGDKKAGDVTGQGDKGVWYVVNPDGTEQKK